MIDSDRKMNITIIQWVSAIWREMLLTLYHKIPIFNNLKKKPLENIVGKGENAGNQHFHLFPQCFLLFPKQISIFDSCTGAIFGWVRRENIPFL